MITRTRVAVLAVLAVLALAACAQEDRAAKSADEMAEKLLERLPPAPERTLKPAAQPRQQPAAPFEVYTWQVRVRQGRRVIEVLGKNLTAPASLVIGDTSVALTPARDGRSAVAPYPPVEAADQPMVVIVNDRQAALPERFSQLKLEGRLPRIGQCRFRRERVPAPERIAEVGGQTVDAVRFECSVSGFEPRDAPVTAFFGSFVVPNSQITEGENSITGYVYRADRLEDGVPLLIDFGLGLRVLAPEPFRSP